VSNRADDRVASKAIAHRHDSINVERGERIAAAIAGAAPILPTLARS